MYGKTYICTHTHTYLEKKPTLFSGKVNSWEWAISD